MTLGTGNYLTVGLLVSFPLLYGNGYCAYKCTDFFNFIFAMKQGGLETTFEV